MHACFREKGKVIFEKRVHIAAKTQKPIRMNDDGSHLSLSLLLSLTLSFCIRIHSIANSLDTKHEKRMTATIIPLQQ